MNKRGEINKTSIWIVMILVISIISLLFYNLLIKDFIAPELFKPEVKIKESCVECHNPSRDMSEWHSYEKIGCVSCHAGNAGESDILAAHTDMISIPGNLSNAKQSCGTVGCHPGIAERVDNSLMTSMSGVVNIQRYFFGESDTLNAHVHVKDLTHSAADSYTRNLCASCHLGNEKTALGPITERSRGGGCNACHLNYTEQASSELAAYRKGDPMHFHPSLSLNISDNHCFGCHSRSGRISTSYEGWHESQLKEIPASDSSELRRLEDNRIFVRIEEDIHHTYGLECIDCHSGMEVMGDGKKYYHAEDAVRVSCSDCHFSQEPDKMTYDDLDFESQKIVTIRKTLDSDMTFVLGQTSKYPLVNVIDDDGDYFMIGKNSGKKHRLSPPNEVCTKGNTHDALNCSACHTAWTPQCIKCHVSYDPAIQGYDLLDQMPTQGKWIEKGSHFLAELPTLGIMEMEGGRRSIETFVPGMIIQADPSDYPGAENKELRSARLFAPIEAHTTTKKARDCASCHLDPNTIGYGRGKLEYNFNTKKWSFDPLYPAQKMDGLPEDAWIGWKEEVTENRTTRTNGRPFNLEEQNRILTVGICLQCHKGDSEIMIQTLTDFERHKEKAAKSRLCQYEP